MSKLHHVHVYTTIRVKFAVIAEDHADAMRQAEAIVGTGVFPVHLFPGAAAVLDAQPAEEITAYLVDEADDPECQNSWSYGPDFRPEGARFGMR